MLREFSRPVNFSLREAPHSVITVYIHFESIDCIWMVSLFDLHPIAKTCESISLKYTEFRLTILMQYIDSK